MSDRGRGRRRVGDIAMVVVGLMMLVRAQLWRQVAKVGLGFDVVGSFPNRYETG